MHSGPWQTWPHRQLDQLRSYAYVWRPQETPEKLDAGVCLFYQLRHHRHYVLTSVVIAVLLDNFTEASHAEEEADTPADSGRRVKI